MINASTNSLSQNITVGNVPSGIAYNPKEKNIYVTNVGDGTISVISSTSNAVIKTIQTGNEPRTIVFVPLTNMMYVTAEGDDTVFAVAMN